MALFVGRSDEQARFRQVLAEAAGRADDGPDEAHVVLVRGYGGIGKSTLLHRFAALAAADRFTVVELDWERDRSLHPEEYVEFAGPAIWRVLERIRNETVSSARSWGRWERRRLRGFADFQRQVAKLPELEKRAAQLGIGKQLGHQPLTQDQIAKIIKAGSEVAGILGVPGMVTSATNATADAAAQLASTVWQSHAGLDQADYQALVDQVQAVVAAFTDGLRVLARKRPVVVILDTCELLGGSGPWLREVMRKSGRRVVWVIGTRLEPDSVAAGDSEATRYAKELDERRLRTIDLKRFDDRTATGYLEGRLDAVPPQLDLDRVLALTQGVPLALNIMCAQIADQVAAGRPLEELYAEVAPDGAVSNVVARMANRYLIHATQRPGSELHRDLAALYGLALIHVEQKNPRKEPAASATPVPVGRDPGLLAAMWDVPLDQVATRLRDLGHRHDFVHSGDATLHRDVRDAIRLFLLTPTQRVGVAAINRRAADYLTGTLGKLHHSTVDGQLRDASWRAAAAALLWHTCWYEPREGVLLLRHLFPPAAVLQPGFAQLLLGIAAQFGPYCDTSDRELLAGLGALGGQYREDRPSEPARAAMRALTRSPTPPVVLHESTEAHVALLRVQSARALGLPLDEQVAELTRAAAAVAPGSGATATRIGDLARGLSLADLRSQPDDQKEALVAGHRLATQYQPSAGTYNVLCLTLYGLERYGEAEAAGREAVRRNPEFAAGWSNLGFVLWALRRFEEAEQASRRAIAISPTYAPAHNGLGNTFYARQRFAEAEAAYREAIRLNPEAVVFRANLGHTLRALDRYPEAEAAYREALRLDGRYAFAWQGLGQALRGLHRLEEAEAAYREAIDSRPDLVSAHSGLGRTLYESGRWAESEAAHREAIRLSPDSAVAWNGVGNSLLARGRSGEAEAAYREAIRCDPGNAFAHDGLGVALRASGRFEEAEDAFRQAVRIDPAYRAAHLRLGLSRLAAGDRAAAREACAAARGEAMVELLVWALERAEGTGRAGPDLLRAAVAALDSPPEPTRTPRSEFGRAHLRALALAGLGDGEEAVRTLRAAVGGRLSVDRFVRPVYDLLAEPEPVPGLDGLLDVWREIIAADPSAAGPWGGPDP